ncbi:MAG TPA: hypothetical protein VEF04_19955 [Blastocatellia bacterium]|nr:hypothetical protein [Blastocatellia bacterium]
MNNLTKVLFAVCLFTGFAVVAVTAQSRPQSVLSLPTVNQTKEILTNDSVIELSQLGLGDTVIIEKIRQSECRFDTSLNGLKQLKAAKVSNAVIALMMDPSAKPAPPISTQLAPSAAGASPKTAPNSTAHPNGSSGLIDSEGRAVPLPPDKGAYMWNGRQLTLLIQSQVPLMGANFGRAAASVFVPFVKNKIELQLIGTNAKASFDHSQPIILVSGLGDVIPGVPSFRFCECVWECRPHL